MYYIFHIHYMLYIMLYITLYIIYDDLDIREEYRAAMDTSMVSS